MSWDRGVGQHPLQAERLIQAARIHQDTLMLLACEYQKKLQEEHVRYQTEMAAILTPPSEPPATPS